MLNRWQQTHQEDVISPNLAVVEKIGESSKFTQKEKILSMPKHMLGTKRKKCGQIWRYLKKQFSKSKGIFQMKKR